METNRRQQIIERDHAERYPMFGEIMRGITEVPLMPAELERYDRAISMTEARSEARSVYQVWLLPQLDQRRSMRTESQLPCADPGVIEAFFPDWPDVEDSDATGSTDFQTETAVAEIDLAMAKQTCDDCPMRLRCLAAALQEDVKRVRRGEQDLVHGVVGGWGPAARITIINRLEVLRRESQEA